MIDYNGLIIYHTRRPLLQSRNRGGLGVFKTFSFSLELSLLSWLLGLALLCSVFCHRGVFCAKSRTFILDRGSAGLIAFIGISVVLHMRTAEEEVLFVDDKPHNCVRIQCQSKNFLGKAHDFRRAHICRDSLLPDQVVINECFVGLSTVKDILGFIAVRDFEPSFSTETHTSVTANTTLQHEDDEFVIAFEHFTPRLKAIEMLYSATHEWLTRITNRS